jgi:hypothetical protein
MEYISTNGRNEAANPGFPPSLSGTRGSLISDLGEPEP